jgi:hypothetical protein
VEAGEVDRPEHAVVVAHVILGDRMAMVVYRACHRCRRRSDGKDDRTEGKRQRNGQRFARKTSQ